MLQTKQTNKGYLGGIERKKLASIRLNLIQFKPKISKIVIPLELKKKKIYRVHFHNKYYNQDK